MLTYLGILGYPKQLIIKDWSLKNGELYSSLPDDQKMNFSGIEHKIRKKPLSELFQLFRPSGLRRHRNEVTTPAVLIGLPPAPTFPSRAIPPRIDASNYFPDGQSAGPFKRADRALRQPNRFPRWTPLLNHGRKNCQLLFLKIFKSSIKS